MVRGISLGRWILRILGDMGGMDMAGIEKDLVGGIRELGRGWNEKLDPRGDSDFDGYLLLGYVLFIVVFYEAGGRFSIADL